MNLRVQDNAWHTHSERSVNAFKAQCGSWLLWPSPAAVMRRSSVARVSLKRCGSMGLSLQETAHNGNRTLCIRHVACEIRTDLLLSGRRMFRSRLLT